MDYMKYARRYLLLKARFTAFTTNTSRRTRRFRASVACRKKELERVHYGRRLVIGFFYRYPGTGRNALHDSLFFAVL